MKILSASARSRFACGVGVLTACAVCLSVHAPRAAGEDDGTSIVRVEEDWELIVKSPDENSAGPQIACSISPFSNVDYLNATFELNHQSLPNFVAGGIQLQTWEGEHPVESRKFPQHDLLHHDGEVIRWTQSMRVQDGLLTFEIINGSSQSWGTFGGQGYLKTSMSTNLGSLNSYSPFVSAKHSGVSYGANRVSSLVLVRVRLFNADGDVAEYANPIPVCSSN